MILQCKFYNVCVSVRFRFRVHACLFVGVFVCRCVCTVSVNAITEGSTQINGTANYNPFCTLPLTQLRKDLSFSRQRSGLCLPCTRPQPLVRMQSFLNLQQTPTHLLKCTDTYNKAHECSGMSYRN